MQGLLLSIIIVPANKNDSTLYILTLKNFNIKRPVGRPVNRPSKVTADVMYDTAKIRKYNRRKGIKANIPVNKRNRKKKKRGRSIKVDHEGYKKKSIVERFFSWIESYKKVFPRYEIKFRSSNNRTTEELITQWGVNTVHSNRSLSKRASWHEQRNGNK